MRWLALFVIGVMVGVTISCPSLAQEGTQQQGIIAPQQGGVTGGAPIVDSAASPGGYVFSLGGDRSSCLTPEVRYGGENSGDALTVTNGYQVGTMYLVSSCTDKLEYVFCSTGPEDDHFHCHPHYNPAYHGTSYETGMWWIGPSSADPVPIARGNKIVWFACENNDGLALPIMTSADPPRGICKRPVSTDETILSSISWQFDELYEAVITPPPVDTVPSKVNPRVSPPDAADDTMAQPNQTKPVQTEASGSATNVSNNTPVSIGQVSPCDSQVVTWIAWAEQNVWVDDGPRVRTY